MPMKQLISSLALISPSIYVVTHHRAALFMIASSPWWEDQIERETNIGWCFFIRFPSE